MGRRRERRTGARKRTLAGDLFRSTRRTPTNRFSASTTIDGDADEGDLEEDDHQEGAADACTSRESSGDGGECVGEGGTEGGAAAGRGGEWRPAERGRRWAGHGPDLASKEPGRAFQRVEPYRSTTGPAHYIDLPPL